MSIETRVAGLAGPLNGPADLDPLLELVGDARVVLLGEATHGTSEYYGWRAEITKRLVVEKGFSFVAVEGDWPDCKRVDRYVRRGAGTSARDVLRGYERWPTWMWANAEVEALVEWLRARGDVGFYGLDVYSLWDSLGAVIAWVREHEPAALPDAVRAFHCLDAAGGDVTTYARRSRWLGENCEEEVVAVLSSLRVGRRGEADPDDRFDAEQNALVLRNAEHYYRTMIGGGPESWNVRDRHMVETLDRLLAHHGPGAKAIVWEHNTHVGDARFTDMATQGMVNVGQLARERYGEDQVVIVGFGSYEGTVVAARQWDAPAERMRVPPAQRGSWEDLLHRALGGADALLVLRGEEHPGIVERRPHRAIGVVYDPDRERWNYVPTVLPRRYDAFLYLDRTEALHPLVELRPPEEAEAPETFPTGF